MEIYLFVAMFLLYLVMAVFTSKQLMRRLWLASFLIAFAITGVALSFLRFENQDIMMNAAELSWYYILYLFAAIMFVLGIINLWIFRRAAWRILFEDKEDNYNEKN